MSTVTEDDGTWEDIPEEYRFAPGTRVKVFMEREDGDYFDARFGQELIIEEYVPVGERDDPRPYYMAEDPEGTMSGGCVPHDVLIGLKSPTQEARDNRMPTLEEVTQYLQDVVHSGHGDIFVFESERLKKAPDPDDSWPEGVHPFSSGVEFYGKLEGGKRFGCTIRVTALWETD